MKNILITGGTGFIGRNLLNSMAKHYNIKIISRGMKVKKKGIISIVGDLRDFNSIRDAFNKIEVVIHLAYSKNYPENIIITKNLIKICKQTKIKKVILLSSMSTKRTFPDSYGKNKLEIEKMIKISGLNYVILRPSIVYGPGSTSFDFMISNMKRFPFIPIVGSGKYTISPIYIKDVVKVIEKCINNKKTNKKEYDLPGGEKIYFLDLVNELKRSLKMKKRNIHVPIWACQIVSLLFPKMISKENIKNLTENTIADDTEVHCDLNYYPIKFSEGIKYGLI